jgi:hypothetical protein
MKRIIALIFASFCLSLSLMAVHVNIKDLKNYTFADSVCKSFHVAAYDTNEFIIPDVDTTYDTTAYGIKTRITWSDIWPSLFEPQGIEAIIQSTDSNHTYSVYDRWGMENWAFAFYLTDAGGNANDSIAAEVLYSFDRTRWTVPYTLTAKIGTKNTLLTYYPLDSYDNWKLYRYAKLRIWSYSKDSAYVNVWIVGRIKNLISGE